MFNSWHIKLFWLKLTFIFLEALLKTIVRNTLFIALFFPLTTLGHHSIFGRFNGNAMVELEATVVGVTWRNPHVSFVVTATNENNEEETWEIETTSLSNLRRWNIEPNFIKAGDQIRIAGNPSVRGINEIFAHHVLLPDGEEVLIGNNLEARWSDQTIESSPQLLANLDDLATTQADIFHVWSTAGPMLFPETVDANFDLNNYPLTQSAQEVVSNFDRITDSPLLGCAPKGMPIIMEQPYPMEIIQQDDGSILLHLEEYDTMRTIHMDSNSPITDAEPNIVGISSGRWENGSLIVTTTDMNWGHFNTVGIPLSIDAQATERFTLSDDGTRLDYQITVTDPSTFTEPVVLEKYWLWYPQVTVQPYDCLER